MFCVEPWGSVGFGFTHSQIQSATPSRQPNTTRFKDDTSPSRQRYSQPTSPCKSSAHTLPSPDCVGRLGISSLGGNSRRPLLFCRPKFPPRTTRIGCTSERSFPNGSLTFSSLQFGCLPIGRRWASRLSRRLQETSSAHTTGEWTSSRSPSRLKTFALVSEAGCRHVPMACKQF